MEKYCSDFAAIVVGHKRQDIIQKTIAYLDRINVPFEMCENVYSAAAIIATASTGSTLLVVGCFSSLTVENMRLFSLAPRDKKVFFCCILQKWFDHLSPSTLAAAQAGVFVINRAEQIDSVIKQCKGTETATVRSKVPGRDFASRIASLADKFFLTQVEQDALLGADHNANTENHPFTE
jgi:hypothetical protein